MTPINGTLIGTSTLIQSGHESKGNEGVFYISQSFWIGTSPSDSLVSHPGHSLGVVPILLQRCSHRILQHQPTVLGSFTCRMKANHVIWMCDYIYIYTHTQTSLWNWKLGICTIKKEILSIKLQSVALFTLTPLSTLNGPIMVWSTISVHIITLLPPCCILLAKGMSELDKIYPLANPSSLSNITRDLSVMFTLEKSIFMYFLVQFRRFKIFALAEEILIHKVFYPPRHFHFLNSSFFK